MSSLSARSRPHCLVVRPFPFISKRKAQLDQLSGVNGWTHHDIRRAFASGMASLGTALTGH